MGYFLQAERGLSLNPFISAPFFWGPKLLATRMGYVLQLRTFVLGTAAAAVSSSQYRQQ